MGMLSCSSLTSLILCQTEKCFRNHAASLFPSFTSFNAFIVPWRACRWFRRNLGSVPLRLGYLCVLGFLILHGDSSLADPVGLTNVVERPRPTV